MAASVPDADQVFSGVLGAAQEHHSQLWAELTILETELMRAVGAGAGWEQSREAFVGYLRGAVAEHVEAEQTVLHGTARGVGAHALVEVLDLDHKALAALIDHLEHAGSGLEAMLAARCLVLLFALRMEKEETVLLPLLREAGVDVEALLADKAAITGEDPPG